MTWNHFSIAKPKRIVCTGKWRVISARAKIWYLRWEQWGGCAPADKKGIIKFSSVYDVAHKVRRRRHQCVRNLHIKRITYAFFKLFAATGWTGPGSRLIKPWSFREMGGRETSWLRDEWPFDFGKKNASQLQTKRVWFWKFLHVQRKNNILEQTCPARPHNLP